MRGLFFRKQKPILGPIAYVDIPMFNVSHIAARVDTGAHRGAIHACVLGTVEREGKTFLQFSILDTAHPDFSQQVFETEHFKKVRVRSSHGDVKRRYFIAIHLVVDGNDVTTEIGLSNREDMEYPILLGRRTLTHFLVDVSKTSA